MPVRQLWEASRDGGGTWQVMFDGRTGSAPKPDDVIPSEREGSCPPA